MACEQVSSGDQSLKLRLPGGPTLQCLSLDRIPSRLQITKCLLNQASSALAPLSPVFKIIEAVLTVKEFAEAVPSLLTDPTALFQAIAALVEKIGALASLIPQLSVPLLVVDLIDTTIIILGGIIDELNTIKDQLDKIEAAKIEALIPGNEALNGIIFCAEDLLSQIQVALQSSLDPLNSLFGVINLFLQLIGQDGIPALDDLPDDIDQAIEQVQSVINSLTVVRNAIPVP